MVRAGSAAKAAPIIRPWQRAAELPWNPRRPADPSETGVQKRVHRRGSLFALTNTAPANSPRLWLRARSCAQTAEIFRSASDRAIQHFARTISEWPASIFCNAKKKL